MLPLNLMILIFNEILLTKINDKAKVVMLPNRYKIRRKIYILSKTKDNRTLKFNMKSNIKIPFFA
jgi:hypothetical protein